MNYKAKHWISRENGLVRCSLCPHSCLIKEGHTGLCGVRTNKSGELYAQSYGQVSSLALDPIEKKPLYNFHPGSRILSVGSYGCNFSCSFCQNHQISMDKPETVYVTPGELANQAVKLSKSGNIGIAYTYNEPFISFEYVYDCARLIKEKGLYNVLVTNGYVQREPLLEILPYIDAMNIDLKSFRQEFYGEICGGRVEFVKATIETAYKSCHVEITCLAIPGLNDTIEEMEEMTCWIAGLSPDIPLHITRFFPRHKMLDRQPTPVETLKSLAETARKRLHFVYVGNV